MILKRASLHSALESTTFQEHRWSLLLIVQLFQNHPQHDRSQHHSLLSPNDQPYTRRNLLRFVIGQKLLRRIMNHKLWFITFERLIGWSKPSFRVIVVLWISTVTIFHSFPPFFDITVVTLHFTSYILKEECPIESTAMMKWDIFLYRLGKSRTGILGSFLKCLGKL